MKKYIYSIFVVFTLSFSSMSLYGQDIRLGVKGGLNLSKYSQSIESNRSFGHIGIYSSFKFYNNGLAIELFYNPEGGTVGNFEWTQKYLNLSFLYRYYLVDNVHFEIGLSESTLLKSTFNRVDDTDEVSAVNIAGLMGIGYDGNRITAGVRWNAGFIDVDEAAFFSEAYLTSTFQFYVGFNFLSL